MDKETKQKIQEALSLLSTNRVNTSGLGAPINILKRLLEDSEVPPVPDKMPSAEEYLIRHLLNRCKENENTLLSNEEIAEILDDPETIAFIQMLESFASLAIENERQKWEELEQQNITLLRENEEFRSQIRKMRLENPLKPFLKDKNHPLSCKKCGDYFGINIDHKCFKCLEPLF